MMRLFLSLKAPLPMWPPVARKRVTLVTMAQKKWPKTQKSTVMFSEWKGDHIKRNFHVNQASNFQKICSSWWCQPIWKICSSKWESSPSRGENKKYLKPPSVSFQGGYMKRGKITASLESARKNQPYEINRHRSRKGWTVVPNSLTKNTVELHWNSLLLWDSFESNGLPTL